MCYHLACTKEQAVLEKRFQAKFVKPTLFQPFFYANGFAGAKVPIIIDQSPTIIEMINWGLVPYWVKDEKSAKKIRFKTLNAKSETIFEKPSFRDPVRNRRCLVLIDGFFDWRTYKGNKYPYYIYLKSHESFALAGIWDEWQGSKTFSIITTQANELVAQIHNIKLRMPVILSKEEESVWLNEKSNADILAKLMNPYNDELMSAHSISKIITSRKIAKNTPQIINEYQYINLPSLKI